MCNNCLHLPSSLFSRCVGVWGMHVLVHKRVLRSGHRCSRVYRYITGITNTEVHIWDSTHVFYVLFLSGQWKLLLPRRTGLGDSAQFAISQLLTSLDGGYCHQESWGWGGDVAIFNI